MRRTISLDGAWQRRDFLDEAWRWSDAVRADPPPADGPPMAGDISAGWRAARVPGSAIDDAWHAGEIPNPYVDRNSLAAEWIPQRTWVYPSRHGATPSGSRRILSRTSTLEPMRHLPQTPMRAEAVDGGDESWFVRLGAPGATVALGVRLADARPVGWPERAGSAYFERNHLTLLPGEDASVRVDWVAVPPAERRIELSGWNVESRVLTLG